MNRKLLKDLLIVGVIFLACIDLPALAAPNDMNKGIELYNSGKYSQSLPLLEAAVRANPYDATLHYYLGLCYQALKQNSLARQHLDWVAKNSQNATIKAYAEKAVSVMVSTSASGNAVNSTHQSAAFMQPQRAVANESSKAKQLGRCKVLLFETSWCHYCHEFAPEFDQASNKYRSLMDFQHIDAEDAGNLELKEKYGVKSYPRLVYLDGKGNLLYNEGRGAFADRLTELTGK